MSIIFDLVFSTQNHKKSLEISPIMAFFLFTTVTTHGHKKSQKSVPKKCCCSVFLWHNLATL